MKKAIQTDQAPSAIGPYSQAISTGNLLFISGQLPIDPATGKIAENTLAQHTNRILRNIEKIVKEAGVGMESIVKTTIFLTNLDDFAEVNTAYGAFFSTTPPARSTVQVAALPLGSPIEIEAIALLPQQN